MRANAPRVTLVAAYRRGFAELLRCRRIVFPVYLVNLITALFAILPVYLTLHRLTAHRPAAEQLIYRWDLEVLAELVLDNPELLSQLQGVFVFVPLLYLLVSQLLLGGVLGAVYCLERPTLRRFGADALGHLPALLKVLVWSALPYAVCAGLVILAVGATLDGPAWQMVLSLLPGLLLLLWTDMALDFARVEAVSGDARSGFRRLIYGYWATLKRPAAALGVHLGFGLLTLLPLALLLALPDSLDAGSTWAVALTFLLRQVIVCSRVALRVASLAGHLVLMRSIFPRAAVGACGPDEERELAVTVPEKLNAG